jgi:hypothetical protein
MPSTNPPKATVKKKGKNTQKPKIQNDNSVSTLNSLYGGGSMFGAEAWDPIGGLYGGVSNKDVPMEK